jgi:hypothetical protein
VQRRYEILILLVRVTLVELVLGSLLLRAEPNGVRSAVVVDDSVSTVLADEEALLIPPEEGVFYHQSNGSWIKLKKALAAESKTGSVGRYLMSDGLAGLNTTYIYRGEHAELQIVGRRPTLYVRGSNYSKEAVIVQLARKRESREMQTSSDEASSDNKAGYKRKDISRVSISALSRDCFAVTPDLELRPGEYLLSIGSPPTTFDFGIVDAGD